MISRKALLGLMTGVSVSALVFAAGSTYALDIDFPQDDLFFPPGFNDPVVNINAEIGPEDFPVVIAPGATIGEFNVNDEIEAEDIVTSDEIAIAIGIVDLSSNAPVININEDGEVTSEAEVDVDDDEDFALAIAAGVVHLHGNNANDTNNGVIDVDASATHINDDDDAIAAALALGDIQIILGGPATYTQGEDGEMEVNASATAVANDDDDLALAIAAALGVTQVSIATDAATTINHAGSTEVTADAEAKVGDDDGIAIAAAIAGGANQISLGSASATNVTNNTGEYSSEATAHVHEDEDEGELDFGLALALSDGVGQVAIATDPAGTASNTLNNGVVDEGGEEEAAAIEGEGNGEEAAEISAESVAKANGEGSLIAIAGALGAGQLSIGNTADATINNGAIIEADADAETNVDEDFGIAAALSLGAGQLVLAGNGGGTATITNTADGEIEANSTAKVIGIEDDDAEDDDELSFLGAFAIAGGAGQAVLTSGDGTATIDNDGSLSSSAEAYAAGAEDEDDLEDIEDPELEGFALAFADSQASSQSVLAGGVATVELTNSSATTLSSDADATALGEIAIALAFSGGAGQFALGDTASTTVTNTGAMTSSAEASATSEDKIGVAVAEASNVEQLVVAGDGGGTATVTNDYAYDEYGNLVEGSGTISSDATATAEGGIINVALSEAEAVDQVVLTSGDGLATVDNNATIEAEASSSAEAEEDDGFSLSIAGAEATAVEQTVLAAGTATVEATNTSVDSIDADASADASGFIALAFAEAGDVNQVAIGLDASATYTNSGSTEASATADADGFFALANAEASAVEQFVEAEETGTATVNNDYVYDDAGNLVEGSGEIEAESNSEAEGFIALAFAEAEGIDQEVLAGVAQTNVFNTGTVEAESTARASGFVAVAGAEAVGVSQESEGEESATNYVTNDFPQPPAQDPDDPEDEELAAAEVAGDKPPPAPEPVLVEPVISGAAFAWSEGVFAVSEAEGIGVEQEAVGDEDEGDEDDDVFTGENIVENGGLISGFAAAEAFGVIAIADADAFGVSQTAEGAEDDTDTLSNSTSNSGTIVAAAYATAAGVELEPVEEEPVPAAQAEAVADAPPSEEPPAEDDPAYVRPIPEFAAEFALASALAIGVNQNVEEGLEGTNTVFNDGDILAYADAYAKGSFSLAFARAYGVTQSFDEVDTGNAVLDNLGLIEAEAVAVADDDAIANASAIGYGIAANFEGEDEVGTLVLDVLNQGDIVATATATANSTVFEEAESYAAGIEVLSLPTGDAGTPITGLTENEGLIDAAAFAYAADADANAVGIHMDGPQVVGTIRNSGAIFAYAEAFNPGGGGGEADAEGILITNDLDQAEIDETQLLTVWNDSGAIVAEVVEEEDDVGEPERGTAIDTEDAPNDVEILLTGNFADGAGAVVGNERISDFLQTVFEGQSFGYIYGDIEIDDDHEIVVTDGKTLFDGVINPEEEGEEEFVGTLTIEGTGTLVMLQNEEEGPSEGDVDVFNLNAGGTLMLELTTEGDDAPSIHANTANLEGTIFALYNPGFYEDETVYEDVIETNVALNDLGFDVQDNSALLVTEAVIEDDSIDLVTTRQGFGEVAGLSGNAKAAGNAIESVYDSLEDDDSLFSNNVQNLFALADGEYQDFMDQLTGAEHAQMLQSVLWSTRTIKRTITERMECDGAYAAGAVANVNGLQVRPTADLAPEAVGCFTPGTGHVWGRANGTWNNLDGDRNAPGYDETQISFTVGADYAFTESFYAGIAGGWISSEMDFDNFGRRPGASADYEGWHVAGYGGFDNRVMYIRGIVDYAAYDGETHRDIRQGISLIDPSSDEADSWVFNFYGEAGYRWEFSPNYTFTPFVGVDVGHAELDSFTENDKFDTGWALKVRGGEADSVETLVGVRFGGFWDMAGGMFRPDVMVAWAHEFDDPAEVDMAFAENPNARFTVEASDVADDALVAQVGGTFDVTNQLRFGIKWDGRFNQDYDSNSVIGNIEYKF